MPYESNFVRYFLWIKSSLNKTVLKKDYCFIRGIFLNQPLQKLLHLGGKTDEKLNQIRFHPNRYGTGILSILLLPTALKELPLQFLPVKPPFRQHAEKASLFFSSSVFTGKTAVMWSVPAIKAGLPAAAVWRQAAMARRSRKVFALRKVITPSLSPDGAPFFKRIGSNPAPDRYSNRYPGWYYYP